MPQLFSRRGTGGHEQATNAHRNQYHSIFSRRYRRREQEQIQVQQQQRGWSWSARQRHQQRFYCSQMGSLMNQVMFFLLCDRLFCPRQKLTGLYTIFFYNVISFLIGYAKDQLDISNYRLTVRVSETSNVRHLALTATKLVLDLAKASTFLITGVAMVLVFGIPDRRHFNPSWTYCFITAIYYFLTEKSCTEYASKLLTLLKMDLFDNLELLWTPILIRLISSFSSGLLITAVWLFTSSTPIILITVAFYVNVYMCLSDFDKHLKLLMDERRSLMRFREATKQELLDYDDVCAVCLIEMKRGARITPCHHIFHVECLRSCLQLVDPRCPLCKQPLED